MSEYVRGNKTEKDDKREDAKQRTKQGEGSPDYIDIIIYDNKYT